MEYPVRVIAHIETDFEDKFGVPRQSSLVESLRGRIVFEPEYRVADLAVFEGNARGLEPHGAPSPARRK